MTDLEIKALTEFQAQISIVKGTMDTLKQAYDRRNPLRQMAYGISFYFGNGADSIQFPKGLDIGDEVFSLVFRKISEHYVMLCEKRDELIICKQQSTKPVFVKVNIL